MGDLNINAYAGSTTLSRGDGSGESGFLELDLAVTLFKDLWAGTSGWVLGDGGIVTGLAYNHLSSNDAGFASHRKRVSLFAGIRQEGLRPKSFARDILWTEAGVLVGADFHQFDFGEGRINPPNGSGLQGEVAIASGAQWCWGDRSCVQVGVAWTTERTLSGDDFYERQGPRYGMGLRMPFPWETTYSERAYDDVSDRLQDAFAIKRGILVDLETERRAANTAYDELAERDSEIGQMKDRHQKVIQDLVAAIDRLQKGEINGMVIFFPLGGNEIATFSNKSGRINAQLERVVDYLQFTTNRGIILHGHADRTGPEESNIVLSQERAENVRRYLLSRGVRPGQIVDVRGHGSTDAPNKQNPKDPMNRAVSIEELQL